MADKRPALGRGFTALVDPSRKRPETEPPPKVGPFMCPIERIVPNRFQPRQRFEEESLRILAASIARDGILQPLAVRRQAADSDKYELIAGERRLRAAKIAGIKEVPCVLIETDEEGLGALSLVENLMREDLNPLDEAEAYQQLIDNFDLTQERIAERVGRSRPHVANTLRLLDLPELVRAYLATGEITAGHGRAILALEDAEDRIALAQEVLARQLSVRQTELLAQKTGQALKRMKSGGSPKSKKAHPYGHLADDLRVRLGTKVELSGGKTRGKIELHYFSEEELTRLVEILLR